MSTRIVFPRDPAPHEVGEIAGTGRVIAGKAFSFDVGYRISIIERNGRRTLTTGTIEAGLVVMNALAEEGGGSIELPGSLGWFHFTMADARTGQIKLGGHMKVAEPVTELGDAD